jgi:hypothetical protein
MGIAAIASLIEQIKPKKLWRTLRVRHSFLGFIFKVGSIYSGSTVKCLHK